MKNLDERLVDLSNTTSDLILKDKDMKTIKCELCGKEIEKKGSRKYCTKCRIAVDKELNRKYCLKHAKKYKKESDF